MIPIPDIIINMLCNHNIYLKNVFDPQSMTPFAWDEDRRAVLRAELDAYYARLYGLTRNELRYILDPQDVYGPDFPGETFRVLKDNETAKYGEYRTRRLVLEAWDRLESTLGPIDPNRFINGDGFAQRNCPPGTEKSNLMSSSTTGWMSNQARLWSADSIFGRWRSDGNPCIGAGRGVTFDTQSTSLFYTAQGQLIYCGDRWNSEALDDSRYVWLPVQLNGERLEIAWKEHWQPLA